MRTVTAAGVEIPVVGLGTWKLKGRDCAVTVAGAVKAGCRHIDTAAIYDNEREVGQGLRASGVAREEVFVTTKIWRDDLAEQALPRAAEQSLERLGLDRVDLLLVHWPNSAFPLDGTMRALAAVKQRGLARAIGVSNFPSAMVDQAVALSPEPLAVDQVEYHPYLSQKRVMEALRRHDMVLTAYSPLGAGAVMHDPTIATIAKAHGATAAQVTIAWLVAQERVIAIPKSSSVARVVQNLEAAELRLTPEETARIAALARPDGRRVSIPGWVRWDEPD